MAKSARQILSCVFGSGITRVRKGNFDRRLYQPNAPKSRNASVYRCLVTLCSWRRIGLVAGCICFPQIPLADELDVQVQYDAALTCALYHRMIAGALKASDAGVLFDGAEVRAVNAWRETQALGRTLGMDEEALQWDWSDQLQVFNQIINFNYRNIRQLKVRYQDRCYR